MGIFNKLKNVLGGGKPAKTETVKSPSRVLRDAGVDPSGLDCKISGDGSLTVTGTVDSASERDRIVALLEAVPDVSLVVNKITVDAPAPELAPDAESEPESQPETEAPESGPAGDGGRTYTVQPGDTLWKISEEMYGNGSKYMKIFEANTPMLENPDRIFPGQELVIPDLDD